MKVFNTENISLIKRALDVYNRQHEAIAKNVAHANDKDYRAAKTDFSELLHTAGARTLKTSSEKHLPGSEAPSASSGFHRDGTGEPVDIPEEMGKLAENQIRYHFVTRALTHAYRKLNSSITGKTG